jgi:hypothetical protein
MSRKCLSHDDDAPLDGAGRFSHDEFILFDRSNEFPMTLRYL